MRGNTVSVKGNLTRDCEVRRTQSGNNAVSWGLAWNQSRRNAQGGYDDVPHFFDVECWMSDAQLGSVQPQLVKGARCAVVDGHLEYQSWEDSQGSKRSRVVVRCDDPINGLIVSPPRQAQPAQQAAYAPQQAYASPQPAYAPQQAAQAAAQAAQAPGAYGQMQLASQSIYDEDIPF